MKCAYHPENDAVEICVRCGRAICANCLRTVGDSYYCVSCVLAAEMAADRFDRTMSPPVTGRSGKLTAGGVLSIVGGSLNLLVLLGLVMLLLATTASSNSVAFWDYGATDLLILAVFLLLPLGLSLLSIIGGICALRQNKWGLALAGAICGTCGTLPLLAYGLPLVVLGILAIIFVAMSKDEFKSKKAFSL